MDEWLLERLEELEEIDERLERIVALAGDWQSAQISLGILRADLQTMIRKAKEDYVAF